MSFSTMPSITRSPTNASAWIVATNGKASSPGVLTVELCSPTRRIPGNGCSRSESTTASSGNAGSSRSSASSTSRTRDASDAKGRLTSQKSSSTGFLKMGKIPSGHFASECSHTTGSARTASIQNCPSSGITTGMATGIRTTTSIRMRSIPG